MPHSNSAKKRLRQSLVRRDPKSGRQEHAQDRKSARCARRSPPAISTAGRDRVSPGRQEARQGGRRRASCTPIWPGASSRGFPPRSRRPSKTEAEESGEVALRTIVAPDSPVSPTTRSRPRRIPGRRRTCGDSPSRRSASRTRATQLKQMPMPQAIGVSSETWQATPRAAAILATASIIGSGPQHTTLRPRRFVQHLLGQFGHQSMMAGRAVVGARANLDSQPLEVVDARPDSPCCGRRSTA